MNLAYILVVVVATISANGQTAGQVIRHADRFQRLRHLSVVAAIMIWNLASDTLWFRLWPLYLLIIVLNFRPPSLNSAYWLLAQSDHLLSTAFYYWIAALDRLQSRFQLMNAPCGLFHINTPHNTWALHPSKFHITCIQTWHRVRTTLLMKSRPLSILMKFWDSRRRLLMRRSSPPTAKLHWSIIQVCHYEE